MPPFFPTAPLPRSRNGVLSRLVGVITGVFAFSLPLAAATPAPLIVESSPAALVLRLPPDLSVGDARLQWRIHSRRNAPVVRLSDPSPHAPARYTYPPETAGREIWFPVVDIAPLPDLQAVATFRNVSAGDTVAFNGNFRSETTPLQSVMRYSAPLEPWENQLFVVSPGAELTDFFLEIAASTTDHSLTLVPLAADWAGRIEVGYSDHTGNWTALATTDVLPATTSSAASAPASDSLQPANLRAALAGTIDFLLRSQNHTVSSPTQGGLYLFYDLDAATYRRSDWIWTYGPAINLLLDAAQRPEPLFQQRSASLQRAARELAEASLRFQINDPSHPADGLVLCRYDPRTDTVHGAEGYASPADSWFLSGWGWIPYYRTSGDARFLHAAQRLTAAIGRIQDLDPVIEQDFLLRDGRWKNWTMDESGFGLVGAARTYAETGDAREREIGRRYLQGLLDVLERDDGLWDRTWHRNRDTHADNGWPVKAPRGEPVLIKSRRTTRGTGWAMIGLLFAHELLPEENRYLAKATRLAQHLVDAQSTDGHWDFFFAGGPPDAGASAKGTSLWSLLFYRLHEQTHNPEHLQAARRALAWCLRHRYTGPDPQAQGGIPEINRESGVVYRRWNELICGYTMSWFGLALLEELKIQDNQGSQPLP